MVRKEQKQDEAAKSAAETAPEEVQARSSPGLLGSRITRDYLELSSHAILDSSCECHYQIWTHRPPKVAKLSPMWKDYAKKTGLGDLRVSKLTVGKMRRTSI